MKELTGIILDVLIILFIVLLVCLFIVKGIHTSDIDRSLSDRVLLLEKQMHERVIPRINIETAIISKDEFEIIVEEIEKEKVK